MSIGTTEEQGADVRFNLFPSIPDRRVRLDKLLKLAVEVHGRSNAWDKLQRLHPNVSIGGALWEQKQVPGLFRNARIELKLRDQQIIMHLPDIGERIVLTPNQVSLESESGEIFDTR